MKKEEIIALLCIEERRFQKWDNTPDEHRCTMRTMVKQVLLMEERDSKKKKVWVSWKRIGKALYTMFDYAVYAAGFACMLLFVAVFLFVLWDYYKQFIR